MAAIVIAMLVVAIGTIVKLGVTVRRELERRERERLPPARVHRDG
jgi:hypothetical protein